MAPAIPSSHGSRDTALLPFLLLLLLLIITVSQLLPASDAAKCDPSDKKVLLQIKKDLGNPYLLIAWGTEGAGGCCDWFGVQCDDSGALAGRVTGISIFADTNLTASIPTSVGELTNLRSLEFHKFPNLTGPIPPAITKLTSLTFLRLDWNSLSGPVPTFLSQLRNLNYLNLAFNRLSGTLPPSLGSLSKLTYMDLSRNSLTGPIPSTFGNLPRNIFGILLSHNDLSGPVPASLGALNFSTLDLSRNRFQGDARFLLGPASKTSVFRIDLSRNLFDFDLTGVDITIASLGQLDLNHNQIRGKIPQVLAKADNLQLLNVSYNQLCGPIPQGGNLDRFGQYEYAHNKCLCGKPLPPCK